MSVPLAVLGQVRAEDLAWQVPGLREEMVTSLVRSLPKPLRRSLVPAPDTARALLARLAADRRPADGEPLLGAVTEPSSGSRGSTCRPTPGTSPGSRRTCA